MNTLEAAKKLNTLFNEGLYDPMKEFDLDQIETLEIEELMKEEAKEYNFDMEGYGPSGHYADENEYEFLEENGYLTDDGCELYRYNNMRRRFWEGEQI